MQISLEAIIKNIEARGHTVTSAIKRDDDVESAGLSNLSLSDIPVVSVSSSSPWTRVPPSTPESAELATIAGEVVDEVLKSFIVVDTDQGPALPSAEPGLPLAEPAPSASGSGPTIQAHTDSRTGYICSNCKTYNGVTANPQASKGTYYAVFAGRSVGVYKGWFTVQPLVTGVRHAGYKKYASFNEALAAFEEATQKGLVIILG